MLQADTTEGLVGLTLGERPPSFDSVGRLRRTLHGALFHSAPVPPRALLARLTLAAIALFGAGLSGCGKDEPPPAAPAQASDGPRSTGAAVPKPATPSEDGRTTQVVVADAFYPGFDPARDTLPPVVDGGRVVVHLPGFPRSLNNMIENSAVTRRMWHELHEGLLRQDMGTWEYLPALAKSYVVEDQLVLEGGDVASGEGVLVGAVADLGDRWRVTPRARGEKPEPPREVAKAPGQRLLRATAYSFELRPGVHWQDGAEFDARDVVFSMRCFRNPEVDCDQKRYQFDKLVRFDAPSPLEVRFAFAEPYFLALGTFASLTILPAHLYDLSDPRNPAHQPGASDAAQARFVHEHPANRAWIGLGPYRMVEWNDRAIIAKRWDGYHDRANGGHVDEIVWRAIPGNGPMMTALLEGELDFCDLLTGEDYFGGRTENEAFTSRYYKGYFYAPAISFTGWNMRRAKFQDVKVRTALGLCFDWDAFIASYYKGLAERVTGEQYLHGPAYDSGVEPLPFDLERARKLLAEAGWYDRDQDGIVDRDGVPLVVEYLYPTDNRTSELSGQAFQANLAKVGVRLELVTREWAALGARLDECDFDAVAMGWITPPVVDPEQAWHSKWAGKNTANYSGIADAQVDRLIGAIQVELDPAHRKELFSELQRRVHDLQPYMFGVNVPRKFAMSKRVRNLECFGIDPGYSIRRWYVVEK